MSVLVLHTAANKSVSIDRLGFGFRNSSNTIGELRVYVKDMPTGLIVGDKRFITELRSFFNKAGIFGDGMTYSSKGVQGKDYVSFYVNDGFIDTWDAVMVKRTGSKGSKGPGGVVHGPVKQKKAVSFGM